VNVPPDGGIYHYVREGISVRKLHKAVLAAIMITVAAVMMTGPAVASSPRLALPAPTGHYPVGAAELHLVDKARLDPWVPASGPRELMVSMFYPALLPMGAPRQYLTTAEASMLLTGKGITGFPPEVLAATRSSAREGAPPVPSRHEFPLVVLSPGLGLPRSTLTGLAEDLASKGYVVADIGHNYEAYGTAFPDGHVTTCVVACDSNTDPVVNSRVRVADVSFVLNQIAGPAASWPNAWLIDPERIGMAGHSAGGDAATQVLLADQRVRAGANLDGRFWSPIPAAGLDRPFLMVGREVQHTPSGPDPTWPETWSHLTGWKRWLTVADAGHASFTDVFALTDQLGISPPGTISGVRSMELTRAYVAAFFDLQLKGCPQPLLDAPTAANPEVEFWS
jgi:dienelactone hydrolase